MHSPNQNSKVSSIRHLYSQETNLKKNQPHIFGKRFFFIFYNLMTNSKRSLKDSSHLITNDFFFYSGTVQACCIILQTTSDQCTTYCFYDRCTKRSLLVGNQVYTRRGMKLGTSMYVVHKSWSISAKYDLSASEYQVLPQHL